MLKNIKAVIFDMDGTLIDSLWVWKQIDIEYLKNRGFEVPLNLQSNIEGLSFTEAALYFKNTFDITDSVESIKDDWTNMVKHYYSEIIELKKGVKDFLQYLQSNNYKIGMATSNTNDLVELVLKKNEIFDFFNVIVTTCEVPRNKSFPDVFLETARRLDVNPEECVVFEDTLSAISGIRSAGMKAVGVYDTNASCTAKELGDVVDHLIEDFECIINNYCI